MEKNLRLILLGVGAALLAGAAYAYYAIVMRPLSWPRTSALVVSSRVVNPNRPGQYQPEVVLDLHDASGRRRVTIASGWNSSSYDTVRSYVDAYPAGARVDVAINPSDPGDVRYELGATLTNLILPAALGVIGAFFAVAGAVMSLRRMPVAATRGASPALRWVAPIFMAIGIGVAGIGGWLWSLGTVLDWPEIDATVVDGTVIHMSSTGRRPSRSSYDIQVTFRYDVNGVPVTSRTVSGHTTGSQDSAASRLRAYAPGSRHRIRHRPNDPNVIRFEATAFTERLLPVGLLLMGAVFLGFGVMMPALSGTARRRSTR